MKKIYEVKVATCDCEGRYNGNETEYVATENIEAVVEAKKAEIETIGHWWMGYCEGDDKRPRVMAKELTIREA
jgi:hypothetical protein